MFTKDYEERMTDWLETQQGNGFFEGFEEEEKNFRDCDTSELEWYFLEWYCDPDELSEEDLKVFNFLMNN